MAVRSQPARLGDLLVRAGLLSPAQLEEALQLQKQSHLRLGEILVGLGIVSEADVARVLAEQLDLPMSREEELHPQPEALRLVPEAVARRLEALPLRLEHDRLVVAMCDPLNMSALEELRFVSGREVSPTVAAAQAVRRVLGQAYRRLESDPGQLGQVVELQVGADAGEGSVVQWVQALLDRAIRDGASDIHLEPSDDHLRLRFRVDGLLREVGRVARPQMAPVISRLKIMAQMDIAEKRLPQDGRIEIRGGGRHVDLRVASLPTIYGEKIVIRVLDKSRAITRLDQLDMLPEMLGSYLSIIERPHGMVIATGPTGSGKTSTLMATLNELNGPTKNIVTIEDPVEYQIPGVNHVQVNLRAGLDFAGGLRAILRQDPNVIMVGEIRDAETAEIAIRAALTGHFVCSTIHTSNAASVPTRLIDMGVEPFLVASAVNAVVSQRLARRLCPVCKEEMDLPLDSPLRYSLRLPNHPLTVFRAKGCDVCGQVGYKGRLAFFELLVVTPAIRVLIHRKAPAGEIHSAALAAGMKTLVEDGVERALRGDTTLDEVVRVSYSEEV